MKHFSVNDGLSSATVYKSIQDRDGFLWFATDVGVSRFDGKSFTNFNSSDGLSDNEVMEVKQDSRGRIWFLGFNGTLCYYYKQKIYNTGNDPLLKRIKNRGLAMRLYEDRQHRLWFSTLSGFTIISGDSVYFLKAAINSDAVVMNSNIAPGISIFYGSNPRYLLERNGKVVRYKMKYGKKFGSGFYVAGTACYFIAHEGIVWMKDTLQRLIIPLGKDYEETLQLDMILSADRKLWVSTSGKGVFRYDIAKPSVAPQNYLKNRIVSSLLEDHEHNIWIGTIGEGVYMLPSWYSTVKNYSTVDGLDASQVECIAKDGKGNIYAGLNNGNINTIDSDSVRLLPYKKNALKSNRVMQICIQGDNCWIGSDRQLNYMDLGTGKDSIAESRWSRVVTANTVTGVKRISVRNGQTAVATSYCCFMLQRGKNGNYENYFRFLLKHTERTYAVFIDKDGTLWYSTINGLNSYRDGNETAHGRENPLLGNRIVDIASAEDGMLVLACYGQGILFYKDGRVFRQITEKDGLTSDVCRRIFIYDDDIYVATPKGATRIRYRDGRVLFVRKYTNADGLASNDVNDVYADDRDICFATSEGVSVLRSKEEAIGFVTPPLFITGIRCGWRSLSKDSSYRLSHSQNSLLFNFTALSFQLPDEVVYQYRIRNNQSWKTTKATSLDFPFLPPDHYVFQLRAKLKNSPWSPVRTFSFTILPPFWQTAWFALLVVVLAAVVLIILYQWRMRVIRKKRASKLQLESQIMHLEQQALQSAMNPHFIFNVMNSIQHFINDHDTRAANLYLSDFASLIRMNMDIASKSLIPLDEEIVYLRLYLSLESLRLKNRLTYAIEVDEELDTDETLIPVMILQPFLENAIWHGISPAKGPGHIQLLITRQGKDLLMIRIIDNGVGIARSAEEARVNGNGHESKGMKLTRQRLDLIGKMSGQSLYVHILDESLGEHENGTRIELTLPANLNS